MARRPSADLALLEQAIGYEFKDRRRLIFALTHVSALSSQEGRTGSYQRFEFLGDRVLGLCVCDMLIAAFPDEAEGELSRRLAALVRKETCADVAEAWNVGPYLKLGTGYGAAGGRRNRAVLADVCEAIVGAVFLDSDYATARQVVERAFGERMRAAPVATRDAKTTLQEWAQGLGLPPPVYREAERSGPDHAPLFTIEVSVDGKAPAAATGATKRLGEQAAAEAMLRREQVWSID